MLAVLGAGLHNDNDGALIAQLESQLCVGCHRGGAAAFQGRLFEGESLAV